MVVASFSLCLAQKMKVTDARIQGKEERRTDIDSLQKKHFDIDCLYHRQGNEQKQVAVHQI
jgi:hypothetical protein